MTAIPAMPDTTVAREVAVTVSSKGQVVIPVHVRRRLGLVQGSVLRFVLDADGVHLLPAATDVRRLKGRLAPPAAPVSIERMNEAISARRVLAAEATLAKGRKRRVDVP